MGGGQNEGNYGIEVIAKPTGSNPKAEKFDFLYFWVV